MIDSKLFWNKQAKRYFKSPIKNEAVYQKKLTMTQEYLNPESQVLEFGCGSGSTALLHAPYVKHITATDISDNMIKIAKQQAREAGVKNISFQRGTLDELDLQNESFDVVLGLNVLHLLKDVDGTIRNVHQLLRNGGLFFSSTVLLGDINLFFRGAISILQFTNLAPYVSILTKEKLTTKLTHAGFSIERDWQPSPESVFLIARKD